MHSKDFDRQLILATLIIFTIGIGFLFSATYQRGPEIVIKQLLWFCLGSTIFIFIINLDYRKILEISPLLYVLMIILLIGVLVFGSKRFGAQRWLEIGPINFQPSEFAKLIIMLVCVRFLSTAKPYSFKQIVPILLLFGVPFFLILKEPDLGTAIMLVPLFLGLLFVWGISKRALISLTIIGILILPFGWHILRDYQRERLLVFLNPDIDPLGAGYTIIQSKIAIGSGGFLGKGWLSGTQNQLNFLAERHTDFIFSVVGEEWGFLGAVFIIACYFYLLKRALRVAELTPALSGRLLAIGIVILIGTQVFVNIAMTIGLMPVVGLPLPFVSYGGSSLVMSLSLVALLESISIYK